MRDSRVFTVILIAFLSCILLGGLSAKSLRADEEPTVVSDVDQTATTPSRSAPIPMQTLTITPKPERRAVVTPRPTKAPTVVPTRVPGGGLVKVAAKKTPSGATGAAANANKPAGISVSNKGDKPTPTVTVERMPDVVGMNYRDAKMYLNEALADMGFEDVQVLLVWTENFEAQKDLQVLEQNPIAEVRLNQAESSITVKLVVAAKSPAPVQGHKIIP